MNTSGTISHSVEALAACLFIACALFGCASGQRLGRGATSGALDELREESRAREERGERAPLEQAAGNAVVGALDALDDPARQEQLGRVVGRAAESAVRGAVGAFDDPAWVDGPRRPNGTTAGLLGDRLSAGFAQGLSRQLRTELGPNGDGPLARSLSGWLHQASGAMATGFIGDLSPLDSEASGGSCRDCIERRVYELSRVAATGFTDGVAHRVHLPVVVLSFGAGLVLAFAIAGLLQRPHRNLSRAIVTDDSLDGRHEQR